MRRLNFGCGTGEILTGYENYDVGVPDNILVNYIDLEEKLPFKTSSIHEIRIHGVLEHIINWIPLMREMYRVLEDGGILDINVPNFASKTMFNDPTHRNFFTDATFLYFDKDYVSNKSTYYAGFGCNFRIVSLKKSGRKYRLLRMLRVPVEPIEFMAGNIDVVLQAVKE